MTASFVSLEAFRVTRRWRRGGAAERQLRRRRETAMTTQDLPHVRAVDVADAQAVAGSHLEALAAAVVRSLG